jgi:hypothetical protein
VNGTRWIIIDIVPPKLKCLKVYGKLTIQEDMNFTLSVTCVEIYGVFDISDNGQPYKGDVAIELYGTKRTSVPMTVGEYSSNFQLFFKMGC